MFKLFFDKRRFSDEKDQKHFFFKYWLNIRGDGSVPIK